MEGTELQPYVEQTTFLRRIRRSSACCGSVSTFQPVDCTEATSNGHGPIRVSPSGRCRPRGFEPSTINAAIPPITRSTSAKVGNAPYFNSRKGESPMCIARRIKLFILPVQVFCSFLDFILLCSGLSLMEKVVKRRLRRGAAPEVLEGGEKVLSELLGSDAEFFQGLDEVRLDGLIVGR